MTDHETSRYGNFLLDVATNDPNWGDENLGQVVVFFGGRPRFTLPFLA